MASGKSNSWAQELEDLLFQNTNAGGIGDTTGLRGSSTAGSLYISLHTANPAASGNQTTSEAAYTSYARVAVARSGSGWTRSSQTTSNVAAISFPAATGGSETETYVGIGTASSGAGTLIYFGQLTNSLAVSNGITPSFAIGALTILEA